jgi:hypothetical protein
VLPITLETALSRNGDILYAPVSTEEAVMLSISAGRYYGLNAVGARIWELIATPMTVSEICARLCEEFEVDAQNCELAVLEFVNEVVDRGIVHAA